MSDETEWLEIQLSEINLEIDVLCRLVEHLKNKQMLTTDRSERDRLGLEISELLLRIPASRNIQNRYDATTPLGIRLFETQSRLAKLRHG